MLLVTQGFELEETYSGIRIGMWQSRKSHEIGRHVDQGKVVARREGGILVISLA